MNNIIISAGHNLKARGAHNGNGFYEYPETFFWAKGIVDHYNDIAPRNVSKAFLLNGMGLKGKVQEVNNMCHISDVVLAMEVHFNSAPGGGAKGCETLYCPGSETGRRVAEAVHASYRDLFLPDRGVKEGWYKMDRPGIVDYEGDVDGDEAPDYFLRYTICPAIIIEPEFIQNEDKIDTRRDTAICAIAKGLYSALQTL